MNPKTMLVNRLCFSRKDFVFYFTEFRYLTRNQIYNTNINLYGLYIEI